MTETFSIIIPTYNRLNILKLVLTQLNKLDYPHDRFEVIVVSDGSTDGTNNFLSTFQPSFRFSPVIQNNLGAASARNTGIDRAKGEYIVFLDDDTVPKPDFLQEHKYTHCQFSQDIVVLGPMFKPIDHQMDPWISWEQSQLLKQYNDMVSGQWMPTPRQFYTGNASVARRHIIEVGGFDPALRRAEDIELAFRLEKRGLRFIFNPKAVVYHYAERSFESWLSIPYFYGINDVIFALSKRNLWLLDTIWDEFHNRHALIRILSWLLLDRISTSNLIINFLRKFSNLAHSRGLIRLSHLGYSGIFNLRYYQGIADQLKGRDVFFSGVRLDNALDREKLIFSLAKEFSEI